MLYNPCQADSDPQLRGWRKLLWSYPSPLLLIQGMLALGTLRRRAWKGGAKAQRGGQ